MRTSRCRVRLLRLLDGGGYPNVILTFRAVKWRNFRWLRRLAVLGIAADHGWSCERHLDRKFVAALGAFVVDGDGHVCTFQDQDLDPDPDPDPDPDLDLDPDLGQDPDQDQDQDPDPDPDPDLDLDPDSDQDPDSDPDSDPDQDLRYFCFRLLTLSPSQTKTQT